MRIDIVGQPGSGKSYLASAISKKLGIPHIHLDRFWFESGGKTNSNETPNIDQVREGVRAKTMEAIQAESWVSDGVYLRVQSEISSHADVIIYLDIPLIIRLVNHFGRVLFQHERHPELSVLSDLLFFVEIIKREYRSSAKLRKFVHEHSEKVITLTSPKQSREYLESLGSTVLP